MEPAKFVLGKAKKANKRQKRKEKFKEKRKRQKEVTFFSSCFTMPKWRILPEKYCDTFHVWMDLIPGNTYLEKQTKLVFQMKQAQQSHKCPFTFPKSTLNLQKDFLEKAKHVLLLLKKNQDLRWLFKRFFTKVRIRLFTKVNEEDPITLEPFRQPVVLHSFSQRKTYLFEAESLAKNIHKQFLHSDGHIPHPICPRNPLTNEFFSLYNMVTVFQQCKTYGHTFWTLEAFQQSHYNLVNFIVFHAKPLRMHALHAIMANHTHWDSKDTLYDFIRMQHRTHLAAFNSMLYKWALNHLPQHERINKWRKLCIQWYECDIMFEESDLKEQTYKKIEEKTRPLCDNNYELQKARHTFFKTHHNIDGSSSSGDSESEG